MFFIQVQQSAPQALSVLLQSLSLASLSCVEMGCPCSLAACLPSESGGEHLHATHAWPGSPEDIMLCMLFPLLSQPQGAAGCPD